MQSGTVDMNINVVYLKKQTHWNRLHFRTKYVRIGKEMSPQQIPKVVFQFASGIFFFVCFFVWFMVFSWFGIYSEPPCISKTEHILLWMDEIMSIQGRWRRICHNFKQTTSAVLSVDKGLCITVASTRT